MKKLLSTIISLLLVVTLLGCSSSEDYIPLDSHSNHAQTVVRANGTFDLFDNSSNIRIQALEEGTLEEGMEINLAVKDSSPETLVTGLPGVWQQASSGKGSIVEASRLSKEADSFDNNTFLSNIYTLAVSKNGYTDNINMLSKPLTITMPNIYEGYDSLFFAYKTSNDDAFKLIKFSDHNSSEHTAIKTLGSLKIDIYSVNMLFTVLAIKNDEQQQLTNTLENTVSSAVYKKSEESSEIIVNTRFDSEYLWNFNNPKVTSKLIFFTETDEQRKFSSFRINGNVPRLSVETCSGNGFNYKTTLSVNDFSAEDISVCGNSSTYSLVLSLGNVDLSELPDNFIVNTTFETENNTVYASEISVDKPKQLPLITASVIEPKTTTDVATKTKVIVAFTDNFTWSEEYARNIYISDIETRIGCQYSYDSKTKTLNIVPSEPLKYNTPYMVTIKDFIVGKDEQKQVTGENYYFKTVPSPDLSDITTYLAMPISTTDVATSTTVVLQFSGEINWSAMESRFVALKDGDTVISCDYIYDEENRRLKLVPDKPLNCGREIRLEVYEGLRGKLQQKVVPATYCFTTIAAQKAAAVCNFEDEFLFAGKSLLKPTIVINFNKQVKSIVDAENAIKIISASEVEKPLKKWNTNESVLTIFWANDLMPSADFTITMADAVIDAEGEEITPFEDFCFTTVPYSGAGTLENPFLVGDLIDSELSAAPIPTDYVLKSDISAITSYFEDIKFSDYATIKLESDEEPIEWNKCKIEISSDRKSMTIAVPENNFWPEEKSLEVSVALSATVKDRLIYMVSDKYLCTTTYLPGRGTESSPYLIYTAYQLDKVRLNRDAYYKLMKDIDISYANYQSETNTEEKGWTSIGSISNPFTGTFDGNDKSITGMNINNSDGTVEAFGLFGFISDATIKNLTLERGSINSSAFANSSASAYYTVGGVGALAGLVTSGRRGVTISNCKNYVNIFTQKNYCNSGLLGVVNLSKGSINIENCINRGSIATNDGYYNGGICGTMQITGSASATIANCSNYVNILGVYYCGGIIGQTKGNCLISNCSNYAALNCSNMGAYCSYYGGIAGIVYAETIIENSVNYGYIYSNAYSAGIVAYNNGEIINCCNLSDVGNTNVGSTVGGIVAYNNGNIRNCYNTGNINANEIAGGICGNNQTSGKVIQCYNSGNISASKTRAGGITSYNLSIIEDCYNIGDVKIANNSSDYYAGGIVGNNASGTITNCFVDCNVIAATASVGAIAGKNTNKLTIKDSFFTKDTTINSVAVTDLSQIVSNAVTTSSCNNLLEKGFETDISNAAWNDDCHWFNTDIWELSEESNPKLVNCGCALSYE